MTNKCTPPTLQKVYADMLGKQRRENIRMSVVAFISILAASYSSYFYGTPSMGEVLEVSIIIIVLSIYWGSYFLRKYRMRRVFFGSNALETKEIIEFITNKRNRSNKST